MSPLTPFPLPARAEDRSVLAGRVLSLRVLRGDPTPEEVAAVTAALLAVLPRAGEPGTAGATSGAARWSRSHGSPLAGSWRADHPR